MPTMTVHPPATAVDRLRTGLAGRLVTPTDPEYDVRHGEDDRYVNFLGHEGEAGVRAAYPGATWDRLAAIKHRYDPANLFRRNQNVPPVAPDVPPEPR